jgi:phosphoglycolate phosphatase
MRDFLQYDKQLFNRLHNTNVIFNELLITGVTPCTPRFGQDVRCALYKADTCDAGILGYVSDLAVQADGVDLCVIYNKIPDGVRLSVRSRAREIMASDFAEFLTDGVGSYGGRPTQSVGFIKESAVNVLGITLDELIAARVREYFESYTLINAASHGLDVLSMPLYRKKKIPVGYVPSAELFGYGAPMLFRTLEGDSEAAVSDDIYIMVGILGEVYPIKAAKFHSNYTETNHPMAKVFDYPPTVRNRATGEVRELSDLIKPVVAKGAVTIHAKMTDTNIKVFTAWNNECYMVGKPGDYIAVRSDDFNDVYVVRNDIFHMTYEPV